MLNSGRSSTVQLNSSEYTMLSVKPSSSSPILIFTLCALDMPCKVVHVQIQEKVDIVQLSHFPDPDPSNHISMVLKAKLISSINTI